MVNRVLKINQLIKRELGKIFLREFDLAKKYFLTIINVETLKDLSYSKISLSIWPTDKNEEILSFLKKKKKKIRTLLAEQLKIFKMPKIDFFLDKGERKRERIEKILKSISNG